MEVFEKGIEMRIVGHKPNTHSLHMQVNTENFMKKFLGLFP